MDYKEQLISMVKEAENLPKSELEQVPGTDMWVKKGSVAKLFSSVKEDIKDESEEYYNAKAYEIFAVNKDNVAKLERFNKNLESINANYEKLSKQLAKLQGKIESVDKDKLDKIMSDIREYAENRDILTGFIADLARNEINANFVKAINEQMEDIRNSFLTSPRGTEIGYGDNGLSILASDKPEYDSLIGLLRLMNTIDTNEKIVAVDGVMCVNASKVEEARKLLSKVKAFSRLKTEPEEDRMEKANQKLIDEIVAELRNIESKVKESKVAAIYPMANGFMVTPTYKDRYRDLLKILKYLNEANDKKFALTSIWDGIAFVNGPDKGAFIELISRTEPINAYNPNNKKREDNSKLIDELEAYLKSMENDYNQYNGVTNIASALTENNTIVLDGAVNEYNYIYDIIEILKDTEGKELYDVLGIASVSYDNIAKFEYLASKTKKFSSLIPEPEDNKAETEKIKARLIELNNIAKERAKVDPNVKIAYSGDVLEEDFEEYQILIDKLRYLETSKGKKGLEDVDGVKILPGYAKEYQKLNERLKELANRKVYKEQNDSKISTPKEEIKTLSDLEKDKKQKDDKVLADINKQIDEEKGQAETSEVKLKALETIKSCLENAQNSVNLVEYDGVKIDADDYAKYIEAISTISKNELAVQLAKDEESFKKLREDLKNKKGKNPERKKERHKVNRRKLINGANFKKKKKEIASEGVIKTWWQKISKGKVHPVESIKYLGKEAAKAFNEGKEKARRRKNIQEQVAEELTTEDKTEQQVIEQISQNVNEQILKDSKQKLLDIIAQQNSLEENSPEYQALDKEAQELSLKIAELEGINPSMEVDFEAVDKAVGISNGGSSDEEIAQAKAEYSVPTTPVTNIAPETLTPPVVTVPPTDDILNTLDGAAETTSSPSENPIDISTLEALRDQYLIEYEAIGNPMDLQAISLETKLDDLNNKIAELRGGSRK